MKKKIAARCEVAPEVIGHFEIKARLTSAKQIREGARDAVLIPDPPRSKSAKPRRVRLSESRIDAVRLKLKTPFSFYYTKINLPPEIAQKMQLGKHYKIQCAIVEVKEDAQS